MSKTVKLGKTGKIILVVLLCLVVLGTAVGVVAWTQSDKFDQKDLSYVGKYSVGGLDSAGNYMSTNASIYTKKPIECQGLNCNLDFDSAISYQLYFYDQNNDFVHTTSKLTGTFVEDGVPFFAKYVRIVITPNDDDKVTSLEVSKYAKQLHVSVNREQGFKNYTENLFVPEKSGKYKLDSSTGEVVDDTSTSDTFNVTDFINVSAYKESLVFRVGATDTADVLSLYFYDSSRTFISKTQVKDVASLNFVSSEGVTYYCVDFNKVNADFTFIRSYANVKWDIQLFFR